MASKSGKTSPGTTLAQNRKEKQKKEIAGYIASIKRSMIHDGPGIRTVVFMKGCPLRCLWCSSPQTWSIEPAVVFVKSRCIRCGTCIERCPENAIRESGERKRIDRNRCTRCGACTDVCPTGALKFDGTAMTLQEVIDIILKDREYYQASGGGVTFSGGEPTVQWEFLRAMLRACREAGIHTVLETTGHVEWTIFEQVLPFTDLLLYDVKHTDLREHLKLTGQGNELILENLRKIASMNRIPIEIHFPVIPGHNDSRGTIDALLAIMESAGLRKIDLLPFHQLGSHEYEELGIEYPMEGKKPPPEEEIQRIKDYIHARGFELVS